MSSVANQLIPVTFPPGRLKLGTIFPATGASANENYWYCIGCVFCSLSRRIAAGGKDNAHVATNKISRKPRQPVVLTLGKAIFDLYVSALAKLRFAQSLAKRFQINAIAFLVQTTKEADHRHRPLLGARSKGPCDGRAADNGNEVASFHVLPKPEATA